MVQSPVTSPSLTTDRRQPRGPFDLDNVQVSQVQFGPFVLLVFVNAHKGTVRAKMKRLLPLEGGFVFQKSALRDQD